MVSLLVFLLLLYGGEGGVRVKLAKSVSIDILIFQTGRAKWTK